MHIAFQMGLYGVLALLAVLAAGFAHDQNFAVHATIFLIAIILTAIYQARTFEFGGAKAKPTRASISTASSAPASSPPCSGALPGS